jgi:hypothetical membrane protein
MSVVLEAVGVVALLGALIAALLLPSFGPGRDDALADLGQGELPA